MHRSSFPWIPTLIALLVTTPPLHALTGASEPAPESPSVKQAETQVIQVFHLENIELKAAMTMVRSLIGAKNIAVDEYLNSLVARDTAGKIEILAKLLEVIDKPRAEVALDVDVLYVPGSRSEHTSGDGRLSDGEIADLRSASRSLMSQEISIVENSTAKWGLEDQVPVGDSFFDVGFRLSVQPRVHAASDEVTFRYSFQLSDGDPGAGAVVSTRDLESQARLRAGETFLLSGLNVGKAEGGQSSWLRSRFDLPEGPGEVVVALTPRIVRGPGFTASDLAAICVGTRHNVRLCDPSEISTTSVVAAGSWKSSGEEGTDVEREAVRQRLRQRLKDLEARDPLQ